MTGKLNLAALFCALSTLFFAAPAKLLAQTRSESLAPWVSGNTQSSLLPGAVAVQAPQGEGALSYPKTPDGFSRQMNDAVEAYQKGDAADGRRLLEQFRLPHSAEWFAEQIAPEQSEALAKRYDRLFASYVSSTENTLEELARTKGRKLNMNLKPGTQEPPRVQVTPRAPVRKLSGIVPVKDPVCFNANFEVTLTGKADLLLGGNFRSVMWGDTFVYQDGAFRFVGHGSWPFWVWEELPEEEAAAGAYVPVPLDFAAETVDEVIPFQLDKVVAALKPAMESVSCEVKEATASRIECKRPRVYATYQHIGSGAESITAVLEAKGDQTHVHISTGKGFYGRLGKTNWSCHLQ